jgi:hypothetical protein
MPVIPATWETEIGRIMVPGEPRQIVSETPIPKITRAKWTRGVAQVVENLLCKCETLISNPSPEKKKINDMHRQLIKNDKIQSQRSDFGS